MAASYATVSWEISTGDPSRARRIADALATALRPFLPCPLLATTALIDTELNGISVLRRALDGLQHQFPAEFFYSSSDHADADIQGSFPPWGDLDRARMITGSKLNPRQRAAAAQLPLMAAGLLQKRQQSASGKAPTRVRRRPRGK